MNNFAKYQMNRTGDIVHQKSHFGPKTQTEKKAKIVLRSTYKSVLINN